MAWFNGYACDRLPAGGGGLRAEIAVFYDDVSFAHLRLNGVRLFCSWSEIYC